MYQEITVPNGIRTEHSFDVFWISQSYLGQSLLDFMLVYQNLDTVLLFLSRCRQFFVSDPEGS